MRQAALPDIGKPGQDPMSKVEYPTIGWWVFTDFSDVNPLAVQLEVPEALSMFFIFIYVYSHS